MDTKSTNATPLHSLSDSRFCPKVLFDGLGLGCEQRAMSRRLLRLLAHALIGMLLASQLAIAAYACPALFAEPSDVALLLPASDDHTEAEASSVEPIADSIQWSASMDTVSPQLCGEHCKNGQQSDRASSIVLPIAWLTSRYEIPARPEVTPRLRCPAAAARSSSLVAGAPPHAILHCVRRT